jgi:hypothetical protein
MFSFCSHGRHHPRRSLPARLACAGALPSGRPHGQERTWPHDRHLRDDRGTRYAHARLDARRTLPARAVTEPLEMSEMREPAGAADFRTAISAGRLSGVLKDIAPFGKLLSVLVSRNVLMRPAVLARFHVSGPFWISEWPVLRRVRRCATAFLCRIEGAACFSYAACDDVLLGATEE